jgi:HEPN domain-containing protein
MDVPKQVEYWRNGSNEDFEVAGELLEKGRFRHALFLAHLALEKMLKAHVTRATSDIPPRIHNLVNLAERTGLGFTAEAMSLLRGFNAYQLEGRYPDEAQIVISRETAKKDMTFAKEMLGWLKAQL